MKRLEINLGNFTTKNSSTCLIFPLLMFLIIFSVNSLTNKNIIKNETIWWINNRILTSISKNLNKNKPPTSSLSSEGNKDSSW